MEKDSPVERFVIFMANKGHGAKRCSMPLWNIWRYITGNVDLGNCLGQSYDNASAMSGKWSISQSEREKQSCILDSLYNTFSQLGLVKCCRMLYFFFFFFYFLEKLFVSSQFQRIGINDWLRLWNIHHWFVIVSQTCHTNALVLQSWRRYLSMTTSRLRIYWNKLMMTWKKKGVYAVKQNKLLRQINHLETGIYNIFWNDVLQRTDAY